MEKFKKSLDRRPEYTALLKDLSKAFDLIEMFLEILVLYCLGRQS